MKQRADNRSGKNKALPVAAAVAAAAVAAAALAVTLFTARPAPKAADTAAPAGGDIAFTAKEIGAQASYFDYDADGTTVQLLAVRASDDTVRMALNTCQVCNGSPYAYFDQEGDFSSARTAKTGFPPRMWASSAADESRWYGPSRPMRRRSTAATTNLCSPPLTGRCG